VHLPIATRVICMTSRVYKFLFAYAVSFDIDLYTQHCMEMKVHGEHRVQRYNGSLGAEPPVQSNGRTPGQGAKGQRL